MEDTCMGQVEINHPALHLMPLHLEHPSRRLISELESLSQHNLSWRRKYGIYKVTFNPLMGGDFKLRR